MKKICKRALSLLLILAMTLSAFPLMTLTVFAEETQGEQTQQGDAQQNEQTKPDRTGEPVTIVNGDFSFTINKTVFEVGEPIMVSASGPNAKDWVGIYAVGGDTSILWSFVDSRGDGVEYDLRSEYDKIEQNALADLPEGEYIIRLQSDDSSNYPGSRATVKIRIGNPTPITVTGDASKLSVNKYVYQAGEDIEVSASHLASDSWVSMRAYGGFFKNASYKWYWTSSNNSEGFYTYNEQNGGEYAFALFPDKDTNWSIMVAYAYIFVESDYAVTYQSRLPSGSEPGGDDVDPETPNPDIGGEDPETPVIDLDELEEKGITGDTSKISLEKYTFKKGEPILVTANGEDTDWVGIYGTLEQLVATKWHYISKSGSGQAFDITQGSELEAGDYYIRFVPNNKNVENTVTIAKITVTDEVYSEEPDNPDIGGDVGETPSSPNIQADGSVKITNGDYELYVNKTVYKIGEPILVSGKGSGVKDWIGIYRIQDNSSIKYQYIENVGDGVIFDLTDNYITGAGYNETTASLPEGEYVIRLQANGLDDYSGHRALVRIKIGNPTTAVFGDSTLLSTDKSVYKQGEPIMVTPHMVDGYTDSWVGIYGFDTYNKNGSVAWEWVSTNGDGVAYDVTEGEVLPEGVYLIRLLPYDTTVMQTQVAYTMVTVGENTVANHNTPLVPASDVTVSNDTHSLTVNKTKFEVGEEILVTATGVGTKDWVGIAERDSREQTIRWYYISDVGNGVACDIRNASNIGGGLDFLKDIPSGLYTIYLVENNQYLKDDYTFSINISVGEVQDDQNGVTSNSGSGSTDEMLPPDSAQYTPSGNGFAGGTVTVNMPTTAIGNYNIVMYWADANGALAGYTAHAKAKVYSSVVTYTFGDSVIVPSGATRLLIYSENRSTGALSEECVSIDLPQNSQLGNLGAPNASFFAISDVHIGSTNGAKHFRLMLKEAITLYPNGAPIYVAGDIADNGAESQYAEFMSIFNEVMTENSADASKYPLFLAIGNHDYPVANGAFLKYATLPDGSHPTDTSYDFWLNGYHYIFLGGDNASGLGATFNEETLEWLDQKLAENRDESRPVFIFLHQSIYNTVSGSLPGEGWHGINNEADFVAVIKKYPEIVMFNGHSHWEMNSKSNAFEGTEELPIHAFNCASVSYLWSGFNKTSGEELYGSHGYAVDVYDGKVLVRGRDFVNSKWIASAQYLVEVNPCDHDYAIDRVVYAQGFGKTGATVYKCANCLDEYEVDCEPIIVALGYSVKEDTSNGYGIAGGYRINYEAKKSYESANGISIDLGVVIFNPEFATGESFFTNGRLIIEEKSIQVAIAGEKYGVISYMIRGIDDSRMDLDLVISAYVTEVVGESEKTYNTSFVQFETGKTADTVTKQGISLHSVSANSLK